MRNDLTYSMTGRHCEKNFNWDFLKFAPCAISIGTDYSCREIIHNPKASEFYRTAPWGSMSPLNQEHNEQPFQVFRAGVLMRAEEMPIRRAAWYGEQIEKMELEFLWNDGVSKKARLSASPVWDEAGNICGSICVLEEIREEKPKNKALQQDNNRTIQRSGNEKIEEVEELLFTAFHADPCMKVILRGSDLAVLEVNQRMLFSSGLKREEIIGKQPEDFNIDKGLLQMLRERLEKEGRLDSIEISFAQKSTFLISGTIALWKKERCYFISLFEITKEKEFQKEMVRLERLNVIGQMAAGVSHEVRNPMSTVRGYLQLLGLKPEYSPERPKLDIMIRELDRANALLTEFLSLVKNKPTNFELKNINDVIFPLAPLMEADAAGQHKQVIFQLNKVPDIYLIEQEIAQLLLNLCRNGMDAMQSKGRLTIRTFFDQGHVILSVRDQGHGIPNEYKDKLGTPFFTTKDEGTGMGLPICYSIAKRHNGYIKIESSSEGSNFMVHFPI